MLAAAFVLGILGSFHCIGMCGPIAFMLPVDRTSALKKTLQITAYHFGRLLAYSLIGLLFGLVGKSFYLFGFQQQISIIIGIVMIVIVLIPQQKLNNFGITKPIYKVIAKLKGALGASLKKKSADTFLTIGFLNGFLPCGLVYMAVFGAISGGNALNGSLYMLVFGVGTIPLMTTVIYASNFFKGNIRQKIQKAIPVFVVIIGALFILRGLGLGIPYLSPAPVYDVVNSSIDCH
ncbi:sulfite exporter TauE/SafE family protein [Seonamhaeicola algicola]|uniref:Sulfite exporter TauE/SafE family protein n=1 Tax=Seonamhaeicola algicola TaxID=1719036 RepID=A0A5C7ANU6_9FLAO|nr:sulfite exporter TauE/SafE family protein [Seonamhaeicola algicola]TXE10011.1 sulfite exporter TauE/SafE family protein [Seonamhaeicola algicola]